MTSSNTTFQFVSGMCLLAVLTFLSVPFPAAEINDWMDRGYATQEGDYDGAIACWNRVLQLETNNVEARNNRGLAYGMKGYTARAIRDFTESIHQDPMDPNGHLYRGLAFSRKGQYDDAIQDFNLALFVDPKNSSAYEYRGLAYSGKNDYDKAITDFDAALRLDPQNGSIYGERGVMFDRKGEADKALNDYSENLRLNPGDAQAYDYRGAVHYKQGRLAQALVDFNEAVRLGPAEARYYAHRASVYDRQRDYARALADSTHATHIDAEDDASLDRLARLLATCPDAALRDGKVAVTAANKACDLSRWKNVHYILDLAAAYAEAGDFAEAVRCQKQAMAMHELIEKNFAEAQQRLDLYERRQPYHESAKK